MRARRMSHLDKYLAVGIAFVDTVVFISLSCFLGPIGTVGVTTDMFPGPAFAAVTPLRVRFAIQANLASFGYYLAA